MNKKILNQLKILYTHICSVTIQKINTHTHTKGNDKNNVVFSRDLHFYFLIYFNFNDNQNEENS